MSSAEQTRRDLLAALAELSRIRPEWRLGQTLANLATTAGHIDASGVWDIEDEEALAAARALLQQEVDSEVRENGTAEAPDRTRQTFT